MLSLEEMAEFWGKVDRSGGPDACWEWQGKRNYRGYGQKVLNRLSMSRKITGAHRVAYYLHHGVHPGDLIVRHKCDNPSCCNPAHLELGTIADNNRDTRERGRWRNICG
jgi:hypothetical protein